MIALGSVILIVELVTLKSVIGRFRCATGAAYVLITFVASTCGPAMTIGSVPRSYGPTKYAGSDVNAASTRPIAMSGCGGLGLFDSENDVSDHTEYIDPPWNAKPLCAPRSLAFSASAALDAPAPT